MNMGSQALCNLDQPVTVGICFNHRKHLSTQWELRHCALRIMTQCPTGKLGNNRARI
jgi:hypothetical protein